MKSLTKWVCLTIGLTAMWMLTRAVVFYFVGVIAVFATAFQATVEALTRIGHDAEPAQATPAPPSELRVQRDARLAATLVDLTETPQKSVV